MDEFDENEPMKQTLAQVKIYMIFRVTVIKDFKCGYVIEAARSII